MEMNEILYVFSHVQNNIYLFVYKFHNFGKF